ncbi:glycosyltransferase family 25 protein, partial [Otariodibacter sp.]|uniref:glycosyltransferase family 25 protein n=1 Tax=Otariodibacter sp. TaxID=3030919 RepID=UPI00262C90D4
MNNNPTPIFIINLEKSVDRKKFITEQINKFNTSSPGLVNYQFFPAINGKENPDFYLFKKYNQEKRLRCKGHTMNFSQLGCWASHYLLWEKCIELNQGIIVLEDDAIIHDNFLEVYRFCSSTENTFEFFWLSPPSPQRRNQKGTKIYTIPQTQNTLLRFYKAWNNTTGYYITPQAAKKLLDYAKEWIYEVDITMERYWENNLDFLAVTPFCIEPNIDLDS